MNPPIVTAILLAAAVVVVGGCCLGIVLMRGPMARLHYIGPAAMLAPVFVAVAILAEKGFSQAGLKAILIAVIVLLETPPLTHILGRAISFHERKQLREKDRDQNA